MSYCTPWKLELLKEGEPSESWVARLACARMVTPTQMKHHLLSAPWSTSAPEPDEVRRWRIPEDASRTSKAGSQCDVSAYCPLCFSKAFCQGDLPHFRSEWASIWRTHCELHSTPLFAWPYVDDQRAVMFPEWAFELHRFKKSGPRKAEQSGIYCADLRNARDMRRLMGGQDIRALGWFQQLDQERVLINQSGSTYALAGLPISRLRNVVQDLSTIFGSEFGSLLNCNAAYLSTFLGPTWLYARKFRDARSTSESGTNSLASFSDPRQRRALISLSMRLLASFAADPRFDGKGLLVDVGKTSLLNDLQHGSPKGLVAWLEQRAVRWPDLVVLGLGSTATRIQRMKAMNAQAALVDARAPEWRMSA